MTSLPSNPPLIRSLGDLASGLSALFWGLPLALLVSVETVRVEWLQPLGFVPPLAVIGLIVYGLWQMGGFQRQERPWRLALDRAQLLAVVLLGLSPFAYWHRIMPEEPYYAWAVLIFQLAAVLFLFNLNLVLRRLAAMLPDETLRHETRFFTALNRWLLVVLLLVTTAVQVFIRWPNPWHESARVQKWMSLGSDLVLIFFVLLPLAMTMALIWKTKAVILDAIFGSPR